MCKRQFVILISFSILFAFGFTLSGDQEGALTVKYNEDAGKTVAYKMSSASESEVDVMGQVMGGSTNIEADLLWKTASVQDGKITHELSFTALDYEEINDMGGTQVDADAFLNIPLKLVTGSRGEGLDLPNMSDMPNVSEDSPMPLAMELLDFMFELPERAVNVNDEWKTTEVISFEIADGEMNSETNTDLTFVGLENKSGFDCMKITGTGVSKVTGNMNIQTMDAEFEGEDNFEVTIFFAYREGFIVDKIIKSNMELTIDMPAMGASAIVSDNGETHYSIKK
ncbi:MAG: hypothetical protein GY863_16615 [bacterium]|nr:hypothetical protein [bacterium]